MMKILKMAAIPLLAFAVPGFAAETQGAAAAVSAASSTAGSSSAANPRQARGKGEGEKIYCYTIEASTGSRLSQRKCRTKGEWLNLGVDVAEKQ